MEKFPVSPYKLYNTMFSFLPINRTGARIDHRAGVTSGIAQGSSSILTSSEALQVKKWKFEHGG